MTNAFEETKIPPGTGHPIGDADISLRHLFVFASSSRRERGERGREAAPRKLCNRSLRRGP